MPFDIAIVGEINLDLILYGLPDPMPLERELIATGFRMTLGSSSAILAHNLAALGTRVCFTARSGKDTMGNIALDYLRDRNIDLSRVVTAATPTGVTILLPHGKERHILTYPGAMFELCYADLDLAFLRSARHFHLSSLYLHRSLISDVPRLFREMKEAGLSTSLDTNDDPDDRWLHLDDILPHVDILLPNAREACRMAQTDNLDQAIDALAAKVPTLVVKVGKEGAIARHGSQTFRAEGIPNIEVVDTVGAGDSFNAGFLHRFLRGADLGSCLHFANRCAAYSTTAPGGVEAFRDANRLTQVLGDL